MRSDGAAVRARALTRRFEGLVAVDGLDFEVRPGELFGLVGPDGAGKTTTLRVLAGVLPPSAGDAVVLGTRISEDPEGPKSEIAYMPQRFGLYTDLTVRENLDFYADLFRVEEPERSERRERLYEFSGLGPFEERLAGDLSGGMKQKLGLSCALIHEPELLLLDEPTFGVDPISRRDLWMIVHEMVGRGVTAIVSTAYMDEAERFDRVGLLDAGQLLALDTPDRLARELEGRLLSVRATPLREARDRLERLPFVARAAVFGDRVHATVDDAEARRSELERGLAEAGLAEADVESIEPSMEDVFMDRVEGDRAAAGTVDPEVADG